MKSEFKNPIKLSKNDQVKIIEKSDPMGEWVGWLLCRTHDNEGWIPQNIVDDEGFVTDEYNAIEFDLEVGEILTECYELNGWIWSSKDSDIDKKAWAPLNHLIKL